MCRHLAYLGPPVTLYELLYGPPHSLHTQSYAPREQSHGTVNADGFGVGWYPYSESEPASGDTGRPNGPGPLRYRRAMPIWADASFADAARAIRATCVVAAVRDATPGFGMDESCAQPFRGDTWLFSHNGATGDDAALTERLGQPPPAGVLDARTPVDSAPLFAHAVRLWRKGEDLGAALASVTREARACAPGRYNLLAADGRQLAGTAAGDTLYTRTTHDGGVYLASEPFDDNPAWRRVPDGSLVVAGPNGAAITAVA
ncbi:glutamine amidotransferase [Lipingzhangella halophila]|uniref:Gamma-glutamyl-hercynylcysteine sulfoxide hydrolase n=1 Tax=Lipingzhangella halophila TaxID=1783352 RepID=A0A7W7RDZ1_9ACTN|nr:ergothioneine biosynthesis protein EgtC [Lipingzhangella halophila]MBB4930227.1 glutamine amidotransferase [Lipingzhangella halophila]